MFLLVLLVSWRFHAGDDPRWVQPTFDDSAWELVDLTAPAGANDGDVGFTGFVEGHMEHPGYAWYRTTVDGPGRLSAPKLVDDAYDLIVDGKLLITSGAPGVSLLPRSVAIGQGHHSIAIRVWSHAPSGGGIHVPPAFGTDAEIAADARAHWHLLIWGYIVDLIEPIAFLILAYVLRRERALAIALVLTALARSNQVVWAWSGAESAATYELVHALARPIQLIAWTVAIVGVRSVWIAIPVAVGQLANELSLLGVPGIWFPFGIGVSRTQFAYAALIIVLAVYARKWKRRPDEAGAVIPAEKNQYA